MRTLMRPSCACYTIPCFCHTCERLRRHRQMGGASTHTLPLAAGSAAPQSNAPSTPTFPALPAPR